MIDLGSLQQYAQMSKMETIKVDQNTTSYASVSNVRAE